MESNNTTGGAPELKPITGADQAPAGLRHDALFDVYSQELRKRGYTSIGADSFGLMAVAQYAISNAGTGVALRQPGAAAISQDAGFMKALDDYMEAVTYDERNTDRRVNSRLAIFAAAEAWKDATPAAPVSQPAAQERVLSYVPGRWFDARTVDEMQAFYMARLPAIREAAKEHGYAIGMHGSTRRDFDLMAMQWRSDASDKDSLTRAIADAACGIRREGAYDWEKKPNNRVATSLPICWTDHENPDFDNMISAGHIDLSIIDTAPAPLSAPAGSEQAKQWQNPDGRCKRWCGDGECKDECVDPVRAAQQDQSK